MGVSFQIGNWHMVRSLSMGRAMGRLSKHIDPKSTFILAQAVHALLGGLRKEKMGTETS
jgi:hypothetical protein